MSFPLEDPNAPLALTPQMPPVGMDVAPDSLAPPAGILPDRPANLVDYTIRRTEQQRKALGRRLVEWLDRYDAALETRMANVAEWRRDVEGMPSDNPGPWPNSSAVRSPLTAIACQNHTKGLNQQILGANPLFGAKAKDEAAVEVLGQVEDALNALFEEAGLPLVMRGGHQDLPIAGNGACWVGWKQEEGCRPQVEFEVDEGLMDGLLEDGMSPDEAFLQSIQRDESGAARVYLGWPEETTYDGLCFRFIRHEDFVILPVTAQRSDDAWLLGERVMLRGYELKRGVANREFDREAVARVMARPGDAPPESDLEDGDSEGVDDTGGSYRTGDDDDELAAYDEYLCYRLSWLGDWKRKGKLVWALTTLHRETGELLQFQYSPYEHGRSPYVQIPYLLRTNKLWGKSVPEITATISDAATTAANQFSDLVDLMCAQAGNFFFDSRSGVKLERWQWEPGKPQPVDDVTGIAPMNFAQGIPAALEALLKWLELLKSWNESLTATSDPTLGKPTDNSKTLGEIQMVFNASQQIFEELASGVAERWGEVADRARWLVAQYAANDQETGRPVVRYRKAVGSGYEFRSIDADLLRSKIDLVCAGAGGFPDRQQRMAQAQTGMGVLAQHPLTAQDLETQLQALQNLLQALNFPGWEKIVERAERFIQMQQAAQAAAAEEAERIDTEARSTQERQLALAEGDQAGKQQAAASAESRAQEQHAMQQASGVLGLLGQAREVVAPKPAVNGKARGK